MIIVSQDKKSIYNFNNVKSIDIVRNEIYITDDILADSGVCIAKYATEERAKEVLREIINAYKFNRKEAIGQVQTIYEMPKE